MEILFKVCVIMESKHTVGLQAQKNPTGLNIPVGF